MKNQKTTFLLLFSKALLNFIISRTFHHNLKPNDDDKANKSIFPLGLDV